MAESAGTVFVELVADARKLSAGMKRAEASLKKFGDNASRIGQKLTLTVTTPLVLMGRQAVIASNEFEMSMAKIEGLVGIAGDEVAKMGKEARSMAREMGQSGTEAANALFYITSAGLRGADAMDVLRQSLKASTAGLGDAATIADVATSALNAYGPANISATEATDILAKAVREGKLETTELAGSMGRVLPIASAMGVNLKEVGAAFAAMSRTGTNAAEAATQLRGILSALLSPSDQAEEQLDKMGTSSAELRKQLKEEGLLSVLNTLKDLFGTNSEAAALVFGNVRALAGIMDLLGSNVDTTRQIFESLNDSLGTTDEAFKVVAETGAFKFKQATSELKNSMLVLGDAIKMQIVPFVEALTRGIKTITDKFESLDENTKKNIVSIGLLVAGIGPLLMVLGKLSLAVRALATGNPFGLMVVALGTLTLAIDSGIQKWHAYERQVKITKEQQEELNRALSQTPLPKTAEEIKASKDAFMTLRTAMNLTAKDIAKLSEEQLTKFIENLKRIGEGNELWDYAKAQKLIASLEAQLAQVIRNKTQATNADTAATNKAAEAAKGLADKNAEMLLTMGSFTGFDSMADPFKSTRIAASLTMSSFKGLDSIGDPFKSTRTAASLTMKSFTGFDSIGDPFKNTRPGIALFLELMRMYPDNITRAKFALTELQTRGEIFGDSAQQIAGSQLSFLRSEIERMREAGETSDEYYNFLIGKLDETTKAYEAMGLAAKKASITALDGISNLLGGMKELAGDSVALALLEIAAKTAQGIAGAVAAGAGLIFPANIGAIATGVGAVLSGMAQAKQALSGVPKFAQGGMVTGPTLAMVGDNASGREAIIPFEKMGRFIEMAGGGSNVNVNITGQFDGDALRLVVDKSKTNTLNLR